MVPTDIIPATPASHIMGELHYLTNAAPEWERLDEMHKGIDAYLGHKLTLCPLTQNIKKILELGCGSGAWAIQAAQRHPGATVIAIDKSTLPPRPLLSNMQFLQLDATKELPFEPESLDIIHARFVFVHLPDWKKVLENIIPLIKAGGWLWIEEVDGCFYDDGPQGLGPSLEVFNKKCLSHSRSKNIDILAASLLYPVLKGVGSFSEVHNIGIRCPTNCKNSDLNAGRLGQVLWASFCQALRKSKVLQWIANDVTSELMEEIIREAEDPLRSVYLQMFMTWSQKK